MQSSIVLSVAKCLEVAAYTMPLAEMPAVVIYNREAGIALVESASHFAIKRSAKKRENFEILFEITPSGLHTIRFLLEQDMFSRSQPGIV